MLTRLCGWSGSASPPTAALRPHPPTGDCSVCTRVPANSREIPVVSIRVFFCGSSLSNANFTNSAIVTRMKSGSPDRGCDPASGQTGGGGNQSSRRVHHHTGFYPIYGLLPGACHLAMIRTIILPIESAKGSLKHVWGIPLA